MPATQNANTKTRRRLPLPPPPPCASISDYVASSSFFFFPFSEQENKLEIETEIANDNEWTNEKTNLFILTASTNGYVYFPRVFVLLVWWLHLPFLFGCWYGVAFLQFGGVFFLTLLSTVLRAWSELIKSDGSDFLQLFT
jgi:hypothetical protein